MTTPHPPAVGAPAPALRLPDLNGTTVTLHDVSAGPVLVSFLRHAG